MQCPPGIPLDRSIFNPTPLIDGGGYNGHRLRYPDPDTGPEIVSLYGHHGQNEQAIGDTLAQAHYNAGITEASQIVPRCPDGSTTNCAASDLRIVFLFIGFSNCDIEVCGSKSDIWADPASGFKGIAGQGCATTCNNLHNPEGYPAWNNTSNPDDGPTESLLYQIYAENKLQQRPQVVFFDGAFGGQTLDKWDPTALGFYADPDHPCPFGSPAKVHDPECNYSRVKALLEHNGFTENQVQAIFLKSSTSFPQCDIQGCKTQITRVIARRVIPSPMPTYRNSTWATSCATSSRDCLRVVLVRAPAIPICIKCLSLRESTVATLRIRLARTAAAPQGV
jgi:hypothetical protein